MRSRWIPITVLTLVALAVVAMIVSISVGENRVQKIRIHDAGEVQELIGGIHQLDNRLGDADAPVTINLFIDVQCRSCATYAHEVVDPVIEDYVRTGKAQIVLRHRPVGVKPTTLGAFATLAAEQQDRGWQYAELFMRNLDEVPDRGVNQEFLDEVAGFTPKLDTAQWEQDLQDEDVRARAEQDDKLATEMKIPGDTTLIIEGENGSQTLEREPPLDQVREAIAAVR